MFLFRFVRMVPVLCMVAGSAWAVGDSAEEVARAWLRAQGLHENWNSSISTMATIGGSSFTIPRNCANSDFLRLREGAFSSAFRTMLREQIASVRMRMVGEQSVNRGTRTYSGERRFEVLRSLLRDWNELEKAPFVWRRKCVYDANGEEVAFSSIRNVENMTVLQTRFSGSVACLHAIRFFESLDREKRICEVAVVGLASPARQIEYASAFEQAVPMTRDRESTSLDGWLKASRIETLVGARSLVDQDGHLWALGFAPMIGGDECGARTMARFWASFAFGAQIDVEQCSLRGDGPEDDFYAMREVYDSRASVAGTSYPDGMVEYRRLNGMRHPCCTEDFDVIVCILKDGTAKFRERQFERDLEKQIGRDFSAGREKSLAVARKVVEKKLKTLSGPAAELKRKALLDFLEQLEHEARLNGNQERR